MSKKCLKLFSKITCDAVCALVTKNLLLLEAAGDFFCY